MKWEEEVFFSINKVGGNGCLQGRDKIEDIAEEWKANVFHLNEAVTDFSLPRMSSFC